MIISTNAGLWGYNIGDTVQFTSLSPYRVRVSGRLKHFISAFGEHVIGKEVEESMAFALQQCGGSISEFTVAPQITPQGDELPFHEWFVEFETLPGDLKIFAQALDEKLQAQNVYYADLIQGKVLQPLIITQVSSGGFKSVMKSLGRYGGQNKVPRLSNDRALANPLSEWAAN